MPRWRGARGISWGKQALLLLALVGLLFFAGGARAAAQEATPTATRDAATLTVVGRGAVRVQPDLATVNLGIDIVRPALPDALTAANTQMEAIIAAARAAGVAENDIQTTSFYVSVLRSYDPTGNPSEITGFQVSNQVSVTVRDLTKVSDVLADAVAAGANAIYGITFSLADPTGAAMEARRLAVEDARARAEVLADATGQPLGRIASLTEVSSPYGPPSPLLASGAEGAAGYAPPIQGGTVEVVVQVEVTFELGAA